MYSEEEGMEKRDKPNFKRRCWNNYKFKDGQLHCKKCASKDKTAQDQV